jgi:hypothetical protein
MISPLSGSSENFNPSRGIRLDSPGFERNALMFGITASYKENEPSEIIPDPLQRPNVRNQKKREMTIRQTSSSKFMN